MVPEELNISRDTVIYILKDNLRTRKFSAGLVSMNLTIDQLLRRRDVWAHLLLRIEVNYKMMNRVITGDELL
jgi:hypothetical protein